MKGEGQGSGGGKEKTGGRAASGHGPEVAKQTLRHATGLHENVAASLKAVLQNVHRIFGE